MNYLRRSAVILLMIIFAAIMIRAQEEDTVTVVGSGIVMPAINALLESSPNPVNANVNTTGAAAGFAQLCDNTTDIAAANRSISSEEDAVCVENGVEYFEFVIGTQVLALVVHPEAQVATCIDATQLNTMLSPSAAGTIVDWSAVNTENEPFALTLILPPVDSIPYAILDRFVGGDGLRGDASSVDGDAERLAQVSATPGALSVVSYEAALSAGNVQILLLNADETVGCVPPSALAVEQRQYALGDRLFMYVNRAALEKPGMQDWLNFVFSEEAGAALVPIGYSPISPASNEVNRTILVDGQAGRQFSKEEATYTIPEVLAGGVRIGGSSFGAQMIQSVLNPFTTQYNTVTVEYLFEGEVAGLRRLCNGELDMILVSGELTDENTANCVANDIETVNLLIGTQAVVLVGNVNNSFAACLSLDQIAAIWGAASAGQVENWTAVDDSFPDLALTLFGIREGSPLTDLLLAREGQAALPVRIDTEQDFDSLYRAAAVANVDGALTYMSWSDYQRVLRNNQQNIQLLSVDGGAGCVQPSEESILDGSYVLSKTSQLLVKQDSVANVTVQSLLWSLYSENFLLQLESGGYIGQGIDDIADIRSNLVQQFALAQEAQAAQVPEVTPEPGAEQTPEATPETNP